MEKQQQQGTQDFMNVESFSQLPFIRSSGPASTRTEKGIRLFGKEVGAFTDFDSTTQVIKDQIISSASAGEEAIHKDNISNNISGSGDSSNSSSSSRKFECHYCCRNFPTSQALGGHQNAHKRERQHAKRAHLQSALAHNYCFPSESRIYNLMNYSSSSSRQALPLPNNTQAAHALSSYPTWNATSYDSITIASSSTSAPSSYLTAALAAENNSSTSSTSMNNSYNHHHQPLINGSPLGLWRIPSVHSSTLPAFNHDRPSHHHYHNHRLPLFSKDDHHRSTPSMNKVVGDSSSSQKLFIYETKQPGVQDAVVSLDLRL